MAFRRSLGAVGAALACAVAAVGLCGVARAETLSADEAVRRAARANPTLRAAMLDVSAAKHAVDAERGARNPVFVASLTGEYSETIAVGAALGTLGISRTLSSTAAVRYTTDIGTSLEVGTDADVGWRTRTTLSTTAAPARGPTYGASVYASVRQPLLRGAGTDSQLAGLRQAEASEDAAQKTHQATASQVVLDALNAYWELWYADRAVAVQEQALAAAEQQVADARTRLDTLGTGTRVDVLQFSTSRASIQDALSQARALRTTRAIELGRILGVAAERAVALQTAGAPPAVDALLSPGGAVDRARAQSPELAAARADLAAASVRVQAAEDAAQPRLDVFATVTAGSRWADDELPGLAMPGDRPAYSVIGGIELELPFGGGRQRADATRARTDLRSAEARYEAQANAVDAQASSLRVNLGAANEQVQLAAETAETAEKLADAERQRLQLGTTTAAEVVRADQSAREAELRRLRAVVTEVTSRYQLEHVTGTLLPRYASASNGTSS